MDAEFQFLVNYRLLAKENESLFWFMPVDWFGYEDLVEVVQSCPSHSLTIVTYYDFEWSLCWNWFVLMLKISHGSNWE